MILDQIAEAARRRTASDQKKIPPAKMRELAERKAAEDGKKFVFETAIRNAGMGFICEIKKASPSKGLIAEEFPYLQIAEEYEAAGASCISVLTEPDYFLGSDGYLAEIRGNVSIPLLRKDFTVDPYQIYQARVLEADCVLLICALCETERLKEYLAVCESLGLTALTEAHDESEIEAAVEAGARMIGVNNRNLKDFSVNFENSRRLRGLVPEDRLFIAESGIRTSADIAELAVIGADGVLIGETLMRSGDKTAMVRELKGAAECFHGN